MAIICENIITTGLVVKETILHVYNWKDGGNNVDMIELLFDNGEHIVYATELKLDLPNGSYKYENGNYNLIEGSDVTEDNDFDVDELESEIETEETKQLKGYINYLLNSVDEIKILEVKDKIIDITNRIATDSFDTLIKELDEIVLIINKKIDKTKSSEQVKNMRKYIKYLKKSTNEIFGEMEKFVTDETLDFLKEQAEKFADNLEQIAKYIRK